MLLTDAGSLPYRSGILPLEQSAIVPPTRNRGDIGNAINMGIGKVIFLTTSGTSLTSGPVSQAELDFWLEKQAFRMIPKDRLTQYEGRFVASRSGSIVDADAKLEALTDRFFLRFGDVPVYIAFMGVKPQEFIPSPIL